MKRTKYLSLIVLCAAQVFAASTRCNPKDGPPGWRSFVDRAQRLCFQYPPQYSRIQTPKSTTPKSTTPKRKILLKLRLQDYEGYIDVWLDERPFDPQRLDELTYSSNYPEERKINGLTFYYNGPGGGGVDYPDDFLFNLHGKILT